MIRLSKQANNGVDININMTSQHQKPVGKSGHIRISIDKDNHSKTVVNIDLPMTKEEQEKYFLDMFVKAGRKRGFAIHKYWQNKQDDFDSTLVVGNNSSIYLELKEIVIPANNDKNLSPYGKMNEPMNVGDYVKIIVEMILALNSKYTSDKPIHLLLYVTDWKFVPGETVLTLVQYKLHSLKLIFENIFFYIPIDQENGALQLIYPTPKEYWQDFDVSKYENGVLVNLDPNKWQIVKE